MHRHRLRGAAVLGAVLVSALLLATPACLTAQSPAVTTDADTTGPGTLTLERIINGDDFEPLPLGQPRWLADGRGYTKIERTQGGPDLVRYDAATGVRTVLVPAARFVPPGETQPIAIENYSWSPDGKRLLVFTNSERVWRLNTRGDYWMLDLAGGPPRKLGGNAPPSSLMFAKLSPDGQRVAYVRQNDIYVEDATTGKIDRLTTDGSRTTINGTFDWVYEEELSLRDGFRWSPDSKRIAYWQLDVSGVRDFLLIDNTDSLYSFTVPVQYPKAGTTNSAGRVGVVEVTGGATRWLAVPGDPRNNYIARMDWAASSNEVVLEHLNRLQNTLQVMLGDARTGAVRTVLTERDSAWVDVVDDLRWLDGGKRFTWVSERDGWRHLYSVTRDGKTTKLLTSGSFDMHNPASAFGEPVVVGNDSVAGLIYFTASPQNATQLYLYRARLDGTGAPVRVTPNGQPGTHNYIIAPGAHYAFHTWSSFDTPPMTELVSLPDHKAVRVIADNAQPRARVAALRRRPVEFFKVDAGAGVPLDGWMMTPPGFDPSKRYPVLFYVYGEPASQTVLDAWDYGTYLWHLMLTQRGYIVMSVDNRGTPAPRGRAFRKAIYSQVGVLGAREQSAAVMALLKQRRYLDPARVAVWGWSGGGSSTLQLMFRYPEIYNTGMAVAPMSDQRFYDTIYTERYMGLPQENAEAYRRTAPLNFASGLRGNLLLIHGSGDDNVHFQSSEMVINALIDANKPFTMMEYPNRTHCICQGDNTTLHLFSLLTRYLSEHMAAGPLATSAKSSAP